MSYIGTEPKDIRSFGRTKFDYTATQGQTAFTGADDDGKVLAFTVGQIEVYVNGILMDDSDFTTTGTGTVTLASAANLNDVINIVSFETNIPDSNYVPASGGTFTGDVDFGANKITYANIYAQLSDLPSASTYHGMFAHVHATGLAYYAHAGAWIPLANLTGTAFTGNVTTTTKVGVGTSSPSVPLSVQSDSNASAIRILGRSADDISELDFYEADNATHLARLQARTSGFHIRTATSAPLLFETNTAERMRISANGYVTTPNQPIFHAMNSTNDTFTNADAKHSFNSERIDVGGHFDTTNSRFVAPVSGYYFFTWGGTILMSAADSYVTSYLRKNGAVPGGMRTRTNSTSSSSLYAGMAGAEVQYMAANDYMEVYHYSQNGNAYSYQNEYVFTGFLIG